MIHLRPYQQQGVKLCPRCTAEPIVAGGYCRPCRAEKSREWRQKNPERYRDLTKLSRRRHADRRREDNRLWREKNAEVIREKKRAYHQATKDRNRERKNAYMRQYERRRRQLDPVYGLKQRMSRAVRGCLAGNEKKHGRAWEKLVGYTLEELMRHLEAQFLPGMTWENRDRWQIDHIVPLADFNIAGADCDEFRAAWSLGNLRPIWAEENNKKRHKRLFLL